MAGHRRSHGPGGTAKPRRCNIRMREVGHADRAVHARYSHVFDEAHREAAEQVAALVRQAGSPS